MRFTLVPDFKFDKFSDASSEFLLSIGIRGIILDIDNTLEPYENPTPSDSVVSWLDELKQSGIGVAFVSNNNFERVSLFNSELRLPAFAKAKKPFKKNLLIAMKEIGSTPDNTVIMGDQIFTDVFAGRVAGIRTILVPPIKDKRDPFTRFKRLLEKPILKKYERLRKEEKK